MPNAVDKYVNIELPVLNNLEKIRKFFPEKRKVFVASIEPEMKGFVSISGGLYYFRNFVFK